MRCKIRFRVEKARGFTTNNANALSIVHFKCQIVAAAVLKSVPSQMTHNQAVMRHRMVMKKMPSQRKTMSRFIRHRLCLSALIVFRRKSESGLSTVRAPDFRSSHHNGSALDARVNDAIWGEGDVGSREKDANGRTLPVA